MFAIPSFVANSMAMSTTQIPVSVYAEMTPNPATMKFVASKLLIDNGATVEYTDPDETSNSPMAARLFNFPFVSGVFIASNFVTVTKNDLVEWDDVTLELREFVTEYLKSGQSVFNEKPSLTQHETTDSQDGTADFVPLDATPADEREEKIINILEEYIRPAVESDGGAIHFKSFNEGTLTVTLRGSCSGCPSSSITLKNGIQALFERMMPEVTAVEAEEL